ncbi:hypothetical protein CO116_02085 [Candidatus Falkowbacteria bacterium CG_4_9_14_3_um_filter_38_19]|uniref:Uncharacterized protein n=1 Tax=Candidatus Falkowbacteria bacterium CG_4_9_14_3_um_filter_38_19 TaxID=1974559 RepID=A0A2M8AG06_9BACT|nr:MAG: hypothetical protein CO116_02085 [Candidatus Falkowbacteria bacterium CG_4_9_14_3_um_filter_38_19]
MWEIQILKAIISFSLILVKISKCVSTVIYSKLSKYLLKIEKVSFWRLNLFCFFNFESELALFSFLICH